MLHNIWRARRTSQTFWEPTRDLPLTNSLHLLRVGSRFQTLLAIRPRTDPINPIIIENEYRTHTHLCLPIHVDEHDSTIPPLHGEQGPVPPHHPHTMCTRPRIHSTDVVSTIHICTLRHAMLCAFRRQPRPYLNTYTSLYATPVTRYSPHTAPFTGSQPPPAVSRVLVLKDPEEELLLKDPEEELLQ